MCGGDTYKPLTKKEHQHAVILARNLFGRITEINHDNMFITFNFTAHQILKWALFFNMKNSENQPIKTLEDMDESTKLKIESILKSKLTRSNSDTIFCHASNLFGNIHADFKVNDLVKFDVEENMRSKKFVAKNLVMASGSELLLNSSSKVKASNKFDAAFDSKINKDVWGMDNKNSLIDIKSGMSSGLYNMNSMRNF